MSIVTDWYAGCTLSRELHDMKLCECNCLHSCRELSIHEEREQGEGVHTRARIRRMRWWFSVANVRGNRNFGFFFSKITHLSKCINASGCHFLNSWKYPGMRIEKTIENKDEYVSESVTDFPLRWHGPFIRTSRTTKKARVNEARHKCPRLHESIWGEASVSIYILSLTLSRVLLARVYIWQ